MKIYNKAMIDEMFRREAVLLGDENMVPEYKIADLFGKDAVKHVYALARVSKFSSTYVNGYGVGDYTLDAITYRGFLAAASFYNVKQLRKDAEKYEKSEEYIMSTKKLITAIQTVEIPESLDLTVDELNAIRAEASGNNFTLISLAFQCGFMRGQIAAAGDDAPC